MTETTPTHCALNDCTHDAVEQLIAPPIWETYLLEERNYSEFKHLEIPLCLDHYLTYDSLRDLSYRRPTNLTDEKRTEANQQVESFFDSLDLELLIDKPQGDSANSLSSTKEAND